MLDAGLKVKGKHGVRDLEGFGRPDVVHLAAHRQVHGVAAATPCFDDFGLEDGPPSGALVHHVPGEGNVHANVAVQKQAVDEGDVAREDLPGAGFEQLSKGRHVKRLLNFDGPHWPVAQLGPLDHRPGDAHNVFHGANVRQTILNERRDRLIGIP